MHYETNKVMLKHQKNSKQKKMKAHMDRATEIEDELADLEKMLTKTNESL